MSVPIQHNWEGIQWDWPLQHNDGIVKVTNTAEKFEVGLEALYFTPNEIQVKVVGNALDIQLEHQERSDQFGTISRRVTRTYQLPDDVDTASIKSFLTNRGTLQISAAKKK